MRWTGLASLTIGLVLGAGQPKKAEVKNPADELQGGWSMVLLFVSGEETPLEQAKSGELIVEDDVYRSKLGANVETSTIKIDAAKKPKEIDFTYTSGFSKGKMIKGIYKIDGDDLTICRGLSPETNRPDEFAAPTDSNLLLVTWKRSKTVGAEKKKAVQDELEHFEASWKFVSIDVEGNSVPAERFQEDRLILKGKEFTSTVQGNTTHGTFKINPTASPKTIDITFTDGPGKDNTQKGIYELDGDKQKICWAAPGNLGRPSSRPSPRAAGCSRFSRK